MELKEKHGYVEGTQIGLSGAGTDPSCTRSNIKMSQSVKGYLSLNANMSIPKSEGKERIQKCSGKSQLIQCGPEGGKLLFTATSVSLGSNHGKQLSLKVCINYREVSRSLNGRADRSYINHGIRYGSVVVWNREWNRSS